MGFGNGNLATQRQQSGATLLIFTALLVMISASVLLDRLSSRSQLSTNREAQSTAALADAKAALISWSVSHAQEPGRLPWPDRAADLNYDGNSDCFAGGVAPNLLLGRFPNAADVVPCSIQEVGVYPLDGAGEPLFYAVSQNLIQHRGQPGADPPINPGLLDGGAVYPWLTVRDQNGVVISNRVAAVIIAPGTALAGQARCPIGSNGTCMNGAPLPAASQYLDSVTVGATLYDNSDNDLDFIQYPNSRFTAAANDAFNDQLVFITIDELMPHVERRVLGDAAVALQNYRIANQRYPWFSPYRNPASATAAQTLTGRADAGTLGATLIDAGAGPQDFVTAGVQPGDIVTNVTRRTNWVVNAVVSPTQLTLTAASDFNPNDAYNVRPAFNGIWGQREGHIPFDDNTVPETNAVPTGFTLTWSNGTAAPPPVCAPVGFPWWLTLTGLGCTQLQNSYQNGTFTQPQPVVPTPAADNGECIWTDINTVDCWCDENTCTGGGGNTETRNPAYNVEICILGCGFIRFTTGVTRTYTYSFNYTGVGTPVTGTNNVKTRQVSNTTPQSIAVTDTVLGVPLWNGTVTMSNPGEYIMSDIYFDIENGNEFPAYFFTNQWQQYIYATVAADHVAINENTGNPSGNDCTTNPPCVTLQIGTAARADVQSVLVAAGGQIGAQNRANGNLTDYFENNNAVAANDTADRGAMAATFNDQARVVQPNPP